MGSKFSQNRKPRGRRILCLDGGGMRGIASIEVLNEIEKKSGKQIHELFDLICGTSTGGILALGLGLQLVKTTEALDFYKTLGKQIFPKIFFKSAQTECPFTGLDFTITYHGALYDQGLLRAILTEKFGTKKLNEYSIASPKIFVVSAINWSHGLQPFLFRTYSSEQFASYDKSYMSASAEFDSPQGFVKAKNSNLHNFTVVDAALATSSAPLFFGPLGFLSFVYEEFSLPKGKQFAKTVPQFLDGGLVSNNPTELAIFEAKRLWPNEPIDCIVSIGTGSADEIEMIKSEQGRSDSVKKKILYNKWYNDVNGPKQLGESFIQIITSSQLIHWRVRNWLAMARESGHGPLANTHYFRFNPKNLPKEFALDDSSDHTMQQLQDCTEAYMNAKGPSFRLEQLVQILKGETLIHQESQPDWIKKRYSDSSLHSRH